MEIAIECKPDEALMKSLGFTRRMIFHLPNKGQVFAYLEKNPGSIGIVDEDPGSASPRYFEKYNKEGQTKFGLALYIKRNARLIVIKPRLEEWILQQASDLSINPSAYSLPETGHELHKSINEQLPKFEEMLSVMLREKSKGLLHLKSLIRSEQ